MSIIVLIFASTMLVYQHFITINAQSTYVNCACDNSSTINYIKGSEFEKNLNLLLTNLTSKSSSLKFYNSTVGDASSKVYGLFQCRYDIGLDVCNKCVMGATPKMIQKCPLYEESIIWYNDCMLRYSHHNIFSLSDWSIMASQNSKTNVKNYDEFSPILLNTMNMLIVNASTSSSRYFSSVMNFTLLDKLYSFAQCTPDLDSSECSSCLKQALSNMNQCCSGRSYAKIFLPSCQLRYDSTGPFLKDQSSSTSADQASGASEQASTKPAIIGAIIGCVLVGLLVLSITLGICLWCKLPKETSSDALLPQGPQQEGLDDNGSDKIVDDDVESLGDKDFEQYEFDTLKNATRGFSDELILGRGAFGSVYKGTLKNGEQLAIKRLKNISSERGTEQFMAEARLLVKLQHRNLVKLNGFCTHGDEKLLVYEFMSNASLDQFLFDSNKRALLDWKTRNKIIMDIANGLKYLHEGSRLTIIHRDLKPGNILLDNEMNPTIADFGTAKLVESIQKFTNITEIVGTIGYIAPEVFTPSGKYSDKSDVYSFGIMVLEIVSGQKHKPCDWLHNNEDLPIRTWLLWNDERSFEITDTLLVDNCSRVEVTRCIQIGLLCVQEEPEQRPTMTTINLMLTGSVEIPMPSKPLMTSIPANNRPMNYNCVQQGNGDWSASLSVTMTVDAGENLFPAPR